MILNKFATVSLKETIAFQTKVETIWSKIARNRPRKLAKGLIDHFNGWRNGDRIQ
jgi:hypothetical protein